MVIRYIGLVFFSVGFVVLFPALPIYDWIATVLQKFNLSQTSNLDEDTQNVFILIFSCLGVSLAFLFYRTPLNKLKNREFFSVRRAPLAIAILLCVLFYFLFERKYFVTLRPDAYLFAVLPTFLLAFREQLIFASQGFFIPTRVKFLTVSIASLLLFTLLHPEIISTLSSPTSFIPLLVIYLYWIYTTATFNIWVGSIMHAQVNFAQIFVSDISWVNTYLLRCNIFDLIVALAFTFGTRQFSMLSLTIFRVLFPFALGRFVLNGLLWIFQTPQDIWRKYVLRKPDFEYGANIIMNALLKDIKEHPFHWPWQKSASILS